MANQAIALGVRAPQTDILGGAIQRNAQMMNMMAQQRAAERQGALAEQKMQLEQQLAVPQQAKAQSEAQSAKLKYVGDFLDTTALAISKVRNAKEAQGVADILLQHFPDMQDAIAQEMSSLPSDPAQFEAWRQRTLYQTMDAKDQLKQHFENITTGDQTYTMATPEYAGGGMPTTEVPGTRVKAPQGIRYVRGQNGEIIPMPTKTTGGEGSGLVGGPRGSADVVYGNGKFAQPAKPISQSTIGEVQDFQRNKLIPATRGKVGAGADMGTGAVGTYQITYGTLKNYAPKVLGPNWRNTPFTAEVQDQIARAIYEDNKNGDLSKVWAGLPSNKPGAYSNVPWEQAREKIAQVESGGRGGGAGGVKFGEPIKGTGAGKSASTESERRFGTVSKNMTDNINDLVKIIKNDPSAVKPGMGEYVASGIPFIGEEARKWAQSAGRQQFEAAILAVLDNITYINTGAGTSKSQEANYYKSYVPTIQDDDASAKKKLERMVRFARNVKDAAGVMWTPEMDKQLAGLESAIAGLKFGGSKPAPAKAPAKAPANPPRTKSGATVSNW